jgi:hypothetical protein
MDSRSKFYTLIRDSHTYELTDTINEIDLVILDININHAVVNDPQCQVKIFTEEEVDLWFDYITSGIKNVYLLIVNVIGNSCIQLICEYPQITSIYIFCKDEQGQNVLKKQPK